MDKKELWLKLKNYHFDHIVSPGLWDHLSSRFGKTNPSLRAFAGKIARKHGWKPPVALKALQEYKKFIYLGLVSDFQVTPSKMIDVVWHEHLLFSKAYRDFCNEVIEQPFDHYPELVPAEEQTGRFSAQYLDTIELYQTEFGFQPPADIWGDTKFDKEQVISKGYQSAKKKRIDNRSDSSTTLMDNAPLYAYFESEPATAFPEFNGFGEGDFGGGGSSSSWGESSDGASDAGSDGGSCSGGCSGGGD